jgi:hypothetical protein
MSDITERLTSYLELPAASDALRDYLEPGRFTGAYFELLVDPDPFTITANDLIAVSMLSVTIPAPTAAWLLGKGRPLVSALLRQIPANANLADSTIDIGEGSAAWELWDLLATGYDIRTTKTSKLLAAKRPALIPISDSVTRAALDRRGTWENWRAFVQSDQWSDLRPHLRKAAVEAGGAHLSDLRVLDIVIWMSAQRGDLDSPPCRTLMPSSHKLVPVDRPR